MIERPRCALLGLDTGGAHLAALLATRATRPPGPRAGSASDLRARIPRIRAMVGVGGVYDLLRLYEAGTSPSYLHYYIGPRSLKQPLAHLLGRDTAHVSGELPLALSAGSPFAQLHSEVPPVLLIHLSLIHI